MNIEIQTVLNSQCVSFIWENYEWNSEYNLMRYNPQHRSLVSSVTCIWLEQGLKEKKKAFAYKLIQTQSTKVVIGAEYKSSSI